jgi:bifunctional non-homologous end joining protein LigD
MREVARVPAAAPTSPGALPAAATASSIKVTNPERVIDPSTGLTKLALVRYYESIAERLLPHLKDRPVSLVRAPEGITGELFFQKHPETRMPGCACSTRRSGRGTRRCSPVDTPDALVSAAQMNTIEFHTWNSTARASTRPDRVVFDLDPGEGVAWVTCRKPQCSFAPCCRASDRELAQDQRRQGACTWSCRSRSSATTR